MFKEKIKNIFIGDTRRLDRGFLKACDAVVTTLGAEGKLALLENPDTNVTLAQLSVSLRVSTDLITDVTYLLIVLNIDCHKGK